MTERKKCGLIGMPLGHSFSPMIHGRLADYDYRLIELQPEELGPFLEAGDFHGLNVTIPYKKAALPFCAELTEAARRIGCVNTILRREDGSLLGHNTDYDGFTWLVKDLGVELKGKKALVLGSGGASLTVRTVLKDLGAEPVIVVSRGGEDNYENISRHYDAAVIANTTPVGMYPKNGESPVSLDGFNALEAVFDVVYNPDRTRLLMDAERLGIKNAGGLGMLVGQARSAAELFTGEKYPDSIVRQLRDEILAKTRNVMLIGMPGSGKSTVGKELAVLCGREFYDCDELIVQKAGCSIPDIFAAQGEEGFRRIEHEVLSEVSRLSGAVIATGGGVVTRAENHDLLRQNSNVVWIKRDIDSLPREGRPLSAMADLKAMYEKRAPMYEAAARLSVENCTSAHDTAEEIKQRLGL